jgi:hypothetical protein
MPDTDPTPPKATPRKAPAAKKAAAPTSAPAGPGRPSNKTKLGERIAETYASIGLAASMIPHPMAQPIGLAIAQAGPGAGVAWAELAETNPAVKRALDKAMTTSGWGGVLAAHLPIVMTVVALVQTPPTPSTSPAS